MLKRNNVLVVLLFAILAFAVSAQTVTITYCIYYYESKVKLMDELIQKYPGSQIPESRSNRSHPV